jgi:acyl dehydratase
VVPLNPERLRGHALPATEHRYDARDTILYALGVGGGLGPFDEKRFLFERGLIPLPTMALVLGTPGFWPMDPALELDWPMILHGSQSLRLARPLAQEGLLTGRIAVTDIADKGAGKPALVQARRTLFDADGSCVAEMDELWVMRGAGGFGGKRELATPPSPPMPETKPDLTVELPTSTRQALLYRLTGDRNPLHVDDVTAQGAGFERPILHGLSTMGVIGRAIVHGCCEGDAGLLSAMRVNFTAPAYPGDTIRTEIWREGTALRFRASVPERSVVVVDGGEATIGGF